MDVNSKWIFPQNIKFDEVPDFLERLEEYDTRKRVILDLRKTDTVHSSFIGFLIHAKEIIRKSSGELVILPSCPLEKILIMMGLYDYFSPAVITSLRKKSA